MTLEEFALSFNLEYLGTDEQQYHMFTGFEPVTVDFEYDYKTKKGFHGIERLIKVNIHIDRNHENHKKLSPKRWYFKFSDDREDRVLVDLNKLCNLSLGVEEATSRIRRKIKTFINSYNTSVNCTTNSQKNNFALFSKSIDANFI